MRLRASKSGPTLVGRLRVSEAQLQLEGDWDTFCAIEDEIRGAEATGLDGRWRYGSMLMRYEKRPGSKNSPLSLAIQKLTAELGVSESELYYRRGFAEKYPEPLQALERFRFWNDVIRDLDGSLGGLKESVHVEWYTPAPYIAAAREVLGGIDLDPASSELANEVVQAERYYTEADDGLEREWEGRVWLNPPYGKGSGLFTTKLVAEYAAGRTTAAVLLLNAYGFDSAWFQPLWDHPICFTNHRIEFSSPDRETGGPANANIFAYLGPHEDKFLAVFRDFGAIVRRVA